MHQVHHGVRDCRALLTGRADDEHRQRHGIGRQIEQRGNFLGVLDDVADIAAPQPQGLGGNHGVLRGDHGILSRDGKVAQTRRAAGRLARTLDKLGLKAAHVLKQIDPLGIVDHKYKCPGRLAIMGWWSHRSARRSSVARSRTLTMEYIIMAPADGARLAACKIAARCSSVTATGRSVVITREGTRGRAVFQDVQRRVARSLDRIAARVHAHSSAAVLGARHTNLLAHSSILANSLRSLYVSV